MTVKLVLEHPSSWPVTERAGGGCVIRAPDRVHIHCTPLAPFPDPEQPWIQSVIEAELPPGCTTTATDVPGVVSTRAWPVRVIEVVADPAGVDQVRLCALYRFLQWGAAAVARGPAAAMAVHRERLLAVLASGAPDWAGPIIADAQIWAGFERDD